jgi:hypothetical protein
MYKLNKNSQELIISVSKTANGVYLCIPLSDPANTDYAEFKKAVAEGAELQDADGVKMTAKAVKAFIATLP